MRIYSDDEAKQALAVSDKILDLLKGEENLSTEIGMLALSIVICEAAGRLALMDPDAERLVALWQKRLDGALAETFRLYGPNARGTETRQ